MRESGPRLYKLQVKFYTWSLYGGSLRKFHTKTKSIFLTRSLYRKELLGGIENPIQTSSQKFPENPPPKKNHKNISSLTHRVSDVMWCDVLWYDVMWCDVMRFDVMKCDAVLCDVMWCYVMWYRGDVMWCYVMWYQGDVMWCVLCHCKVHSQHMTCFYLIYICSLGMKLNWREWSPDMVGWICSLSILLRTLKCLPTTSGPYNNAIK